MPAEAQAKPITDEKIPGTEVPDVSKATEETEARKRWMSRVAVSTAVMAAMAAISTSFSSGHLNQAMLEQIKASDNWNWYQAKGIKLAVLEGRLDAARESGQPVSAPAAARQAKYESEQADIRKEAEAHQASSEDHRRRFQSMSRASTALQIGIALAAVALLTRRNAFWMLSLVVGVVGAVFIVMGLLPGGTLAR